MLFSLFANPQLPCVYTLIGFDDPEVLTFPEKSLNDPSIIFMMKMRYDFQNKYACEPKHIFTTIRCILTINQSAHLCQMMSNDNGRLKAEIVLHNAAEDVEGQYRAGVAHMGVVVDLGSESWVALLLRTTAIVRNNSRNILQ